MLAEEIYGFFRSQPVGSSVAAVLPCGTGATAYLVHREIRRLMGVYEGEGRLEVFGVGCVGGERGAKAQMKRLAEEMGHAKDGKVDLPEVREIVTSEGRAGNETVT